MSTPTTCLRNLISRPMNRSGNILMSALEPMSDQEFFSGGASGISPAWTVGHLACVSDLFSSWFIDRKVLLEKPVHDVFNSLDIGPGSGITKAETVNPDVYSKAHILWMFRGSQVRALEVLQQFDVRRWEEATDDSIPDSLPTWGAIWEHLSVHTYWHLGELAGSLQRFHGTYTLNTILHYFYPGIPNPEPAVMTGGAA